MQSASAAAATKSVKDRLGMVSAPKKPLAPVAPPVESESGSESSDSVDNIKVLSMEEILRQKALESMMRKRAAEGKALPVSERKKDFKPAVAPVKAPVKKALQGKITLKKKTQVARPAVTPVVTARKTKLLAVAAPVSSESEEESSAETSGPSSSEDSDDSQDESEPDVRRVVVEVDKEAAARKRAKASLLKKQTALGHRVQTGKITKAKDRFGGSSSILDKKLMRRMVNVDYDSDDIISSHAKAPLSVKDRLGKPPRLHQAISLSQLGTKGRKTVPVNSPEKPAVIAQAKALMKDLSSSSEDDALEGIRVKTLEEIRQEKMSKAAGHTKPDTPESTKDDCRILSVKQRLGSVSPVRRNVLEDNDGGGRQVLIAADSGSKSDESSNAKTTVEQKKVKRRPWRSKKSMVAGALGETEEKTNVGDERTAVVISPDLTGLLDIHTPQLEDTTREETAEEESPFHRLKRRALQKKLQSLQQSKEFSSLARTVFQDSVISEERQGAGDVGGNVENKEKEVEEDGKESHKKHKHKHKHKHHKKSKKERQIYMPPALKNAASQEQETVALKEEISPIAGTAAPTIKVAPQRRVGPHPIGAAWAAGLSLSSKGSTHSARRPLTSTTASASAAPVPVGVAGVVGRLGQKPVEPGKKIKPISTLASSSEPTGALIKSFSEIMAEKRRRRLEMQASQAQSQISASLSSFSQPSIASPQSTSPLKLTGAASSPIKVTDSRPRVPISPVVFSTDNQSSLIKPKFQVKSSASDIFSSEPAECATAPPSTSPNVQSIQPSLLSQSKAQNTPSSSSLSCIRQSTMPQHEVLSMPEVPENKKNAIKRGAKKSLGQKKLFKKRKSVEQVTACSPNKAPEMTESIGISIPLPPMTLEEELLLDDGSDSLMEIDRLSENIQTNEPRSSAVPKIDMYEPFKQQQLLPDPLATVPAVSSVEKHKSSPADNSEVSMKKDRLSIEDEFALFDEELENLGDVSSLDVGDSVEPIDDLLQNIDDLLA